MLNEIVTVYGLLESFPEDQQELIRRAALKQGVAVEVLMKSALVELAGRINASVGDTPPDSPDMRAAA